MHPEMPADVARLSAIESELLEARKREELNQSTLKAILERIETLSLHSTIQPSVSPTPHTPITPRPRPQLRASPPKEFSGERSAGLAFLNSCKLYLSLCSDEFVDDQARIMWALSYMKEGRAAQFADRCLRTEAYNQFPMFETWSHFEAEFTTQFLPPHRDIDAANRLESTSFYQGKRSVEEYLDEFRYLVDQAGYEEGLGIVMKFRRGLNPSLQNQIAILGDGRPADNNPGAWYAAARLYEQSRASNAAFVQSHASSPSSRLQNPIRPTVPSGARGLSSFPTAALQCSPFAAGAPAPASNRPTPMDVDSVRKRSTTTLACHRCGEVGHLIRDCPRGFDVRYMTADERDEWVQQLLVAKDVAEVEQKVDVLTSEVVEDFGVNDE